MNETEEQKSQNSSQKASRLLKLCLLAVGVVYLAMMGMYAVSHTEAFKLVMGDFLHEDVRISPIRSDLRSMHTALESYFADHQSYPAPAPLRDWAPDPQRLKQQGGWDLMTVEAGRGASLAGLTTPVAYLTSMFLDQFGAPLTRRFYVDGKYNAWALGKRTEGTVPFAYYRTEKGWLVWSPGRDGVYDITDPASVYDDATTAPTPALIELTYDPSNGTDSSGDVWRCRM